MLKIKSLREDHDYTQREIAFFLNMERSVYAKAEDGKVSISSKDIYKLAVLYDVDPAYLLSLINTKHCFPKNIKEEIKKVLNIKL